MTSLADRMAHGPVVLDGGLATLLEAHGHDLSSALWSARLLAARPAAITAAHQEYFEAGAQVAITSSYQASFEGFAELGFDVAQTADLLRRSVRLARAGERVEDAFALAGDVASVVAVGVNCVDSVEAADLVSVAVESSRKPAVVYPNSGETWDAISRSWGGRATFGPEHAAVWVAAGARLVGGCCRVGPRAIRTLARSAPGWPAGDSGSVSSR